MKDGDKIDTEKRYEITCPHCGEKQYVCLSILQTMGVSDGGVVICLNCKELMRSIFDYDAEKMIIKSLH